MEHYCGYRASFVPRRGVKRRRGGARNAGVFLFRAILTRARKALGTGIALALGAAACLPAAAQEFIASGSNAGAGITALPGFEAPGIASGEFLLRSGVSVGVAYDSNILHTQSPVSSDYIFFVTPSFLLSRDGRKHSEEVFASVSSAKYARSGADDFTNAYARASETYLLAPGSEILVNASIADGYERRVSSNHDIGTDPAEPVHQQTLLGSLGYRKSWQNVDAGLTFSATRQRYDDIKDRSGGIIDQTRRNESDLTLDAFFNVRLSRHIESALAFRASKSDIHDQRRNSDQWRASDTTTVNLTSKTALGFLVGVSEEDYYNDPLVEPVPLAEYELFLRWSPIQTMTLTARGGYHDLGVDFERGISGGVGRYGSLDLTYLIRRDLQLTSSLRYENMHLSGDQSIQDTLTARTGLTYELSPHAGLSFLYMLQKMDSNSPEFTPYEEHIVQGSLNFRF